MGNIELELERRLALWEKLKAIGDPDSIPASVLRDLGIYSGSRGVYVNAQETRKAHPSGVVLSLKTTGRNYEDVLTDEEAIYDFPATRDLPRDEADIRGIEAAHQLNFPIFFISENTDGTRKVVLSYVIGSDRAAKCCVVQFGNNDNRTKIETEPEVPFSARQNRKLTEDQVRYFERDPKFKFNTLARYSAVCAVTGINVVQMLDAAHIVPVSKGGSDDPRNGIVLSASAHRAFDANLWSIEPDSLRIATRETGPSAEAMRIRNLDLTHLAKTPHIDALNLRWELFQRAVQGHFKL